MSSNDENKQDTDHLTELLDDLRKEASPPAWKRLKEEVTFDLREVTAGRYEYIREIGAGGMGRVILARDEELHREVAVKILEVPIVRDDDITVARFVREARITAGLVHPGIVPVYDLGHTDEGHHFFIMQVVEGVTLQELLARAKMDRDNRIAHVSHFLSVFLKVCQAVAYAHHKGIVHLDLKPANIMEGPFGEVLVMDWGVSQRMEELFPPESPDEATDSEGGTAEKAEDETDTRQVVGTPGFMAPEQYLGTPGAVGPQADVFALGVILFSILTSERPFKGNNLGEIQLAVRTGRRLDVQEAAKAADQKPVPKRLVAITEKALSIDPRDRYPSASELANDVQAYLEDRAISAFRESPLGRVRRWLRRNRAIGDAVLVLLVTGLLTLSLWMAQSFSSGHYLRRFRGQVRTLRDQYSDLTRKSLWLKRQLSHTATTDATRRKQLATELRHIHTSRHLAAQQLRTAITTLLAAQRNEVDVHLSRELRELWLEEMELAMHEGLDEYVRHAFRRMQEERGTLSWWNWEPDEFAMVESINEWLKSREQDSESSGSIWDPNLE
ncbi:MAG: serine/threonine protein kinase [Lentisphaerae bacterium]|nr:serine/threonine protein kinase [Lentisphaerota bacterium]MBT4822021.1 serine/threonine protein kinase [Lentisphaerota bacterium]MBT5610025.1 serine/threonine protein kinase [Lentisphaerota bacterium]MBT7055575.1 serine/threonine protein kinase [Lentisphaerota bacterium]MBT7841470.1 serine/threonine protein kinase [Lentisphaerota bacterium]